MTREEEIIARAGEAEKETTFSDIVFKAKGVNSAYGIGYIEGAKWADEHPSEEERGMTLEEKIKIELHDYLYKSGLSHIICANDRLKVAKHFTEWANKTMIDKACEWIERNQKTDIDVDDFRQAMEE